MADGKRVTAVTLGNNHKVDAGMMKITEEGTWPFVPISDETIRPGRWCFAIGYPVTYEPGQEAPVRLGRVLRVATDAITSDCTIMGGDSGGPLFDLQGKLIGINSRVSNSLTGNIHVPMPAFKLDWEQMVAGKDITFPAYLGVNRVEGATDAKVGSVVADSAADRAGIKPGDVIVSFNRIPIKNFDELREAVAQCNPEQSVRIKLMRGAEEIYVRARLGELPRNEP
jgi:S1-C subfamily serine protease